MGPDLELNSEADGARLRIYPTLRCNLTCSYCSNGLRDTEIPAAPLNKWVVGLKRVPPNKFLSLNITGGEPLLYPPLSVLVNATPRYLPVVLFTNLTVPPYRFLCRVKRDIHVRGSIHPPTPGKIYREHAEEFLACSQVKSLVLISVEGLGIEEYRTYFSDLDVQIQECPNQWGANQKTTGGARRVDCTNHIYLFGPDGFRYPCVRRMQIGARVPGPPIWKTKWQKVQPSITTECTLFGDCAACDGLIRSQIVWRD